MSRGWSKSDPRLRTAGFGVVVHPCAFSRTRLSAGRKGTGHRAGCPHEPEHGAVPDLIAIYLTAMLVPSTGP